MDEGCGPKSEGGEKDKLIAVEDGGAKALPRMFHVFYLLSLTHYLLSHYVLYVCVLCVYLLCVCEIYYCKPTLNLSK